MKIKETALEFMLGASRNFYPDEFGGMLRGEGDTITEVLVIPGTTFGDEFVSTRPDMVPFDKTIIGSVHSHPGRSNAPSDADLVFFGKSGMVHLIIRYPYDSIEDVAAYDKAGNGIKLFPTP